MVHPIAVGLTGIAGTGVAGLSVASAGTYEMLGQYAKHEDDILDAYAAGLTRRNMAEGSDQPVLAADLTQAQRTMAMDAFRHSYCSGDLKMNFGETIAESFDLWEIAGPPVHSTVHAFNRAVNGEGFHKVQDALFNTNPTGTKMDYWNNAVMRHEDVTQENIVPIILDKMRANELVLDQSDARLVSYEGPGLPDMVSDYSILSYDTSGQAYSVDVNTFNQPVEDYFGFEGRDDVPPIEGNTDAAVQWAYGELAARHEDLRLSGDLRADVETLHIAAAGDESMQSYLQYVDYRLAGDEATAGVKDIKPVIGVETPDVPSTLSDDDPLLNPAGFTPPPFRGSGVQ